MTGSALLLHICCAPDEAWVLHSLSGQRDLICYFYNPNIFPHEEYNLRLAEARSVANRYHIPFHAAPFDPETWEQAIADAADTPEGGDRCMRCFKLRLDKTAQFCSAIGCHSFTTVMSVSPWKNVAALNRIGSETASTRGVTYEQHDFKKKDGFRRSVLLSKELGLYRQDYCGCRLSRAERDLRKNRLRVGEPSRK